MISLQGNVIPVSYKPYIYVILAILTVSLIAFIITLYLLDAISDYKKIIKEYNEDSFILKSKNAIPKYIEVIDRQDELIVEEGGDATLQWTFNLIKLDTLDSQALEFQIYSEHTNFSSNDNLKKLESNIEVIHLQIGQNNIMPLQAAYEIKEIRYPIDGQGGPIEFGILRVPTNFDNLKSLNKVKVYIKIKMKKAFTNVNDCDFFLVEIPQLTTKLNVSIKAMDSDYKIGIPRAYWDNEIVPEMGHSGTVDDNEASLQRKNVQINEDCLVWRTDYPKLGYRYILHFQLVKNTEYDVLS